MQNLRDLEVGLMFWAGGDPLETLRDIKSFGVSSGQLGVPGDLSLEGAAERWKDALRQEAQTMGGASATASVPPKAGEASSFVQGKPNADPNGMPRALSRQEVVAELMGRRALFDAHRRTMLNPDARMGVAVTQ